jgi:hypothetical protein
MRRSVAAIHLGKQAYGRYEQQAVQYLLSDQNKYIRVLLYLTSSCY